jgi:hypothetical protein
MSALARTMCWIEPSHQASQRERLVAAMVSARASADGSLRHTDSEFENRRNGRLTFHAVIFETSLVYPGRRGLKPQH